MDPMLNERTDEQIAIATSDLHKRVRTARRDRGLSQSGLAREVGCKQSAISMFEGGRTHVLAEEKLRAVCELLDLPWEQSSGEPATPPALHETSRVYCPQAECPSNIPYLVAGDLRFLPAQQLITASEPFCRYCGEVLEHHCPECGRPVAPGACCSGCGCAYVVGGPTDTGDLPAWVASQRTLALQVAATPDRV